MKKIQINGKEFSRAIRICRKFAAKTATAMAIGIKDQFIIEVVKEKKQPNSGCQVWFWASDGYRAVRTLVPAVNVEGAPFIVSIRNPVFTPQNGSHVSIEVGSVQKKLTATVKYHEYGTAFTTVQQAAGETSRTAAEHLMLLKKPMEIAAAAEPQAKFICNTMFLKDAVDAAMAANERSNGQVSMSVRSEPEPIYMQACDMQAIVFPMRTSD